MLHPDKESVHQPSFGSSHIRNYSDLTVGSLVRLSYETYALEGTIVSVNQSRRRFRLKDACTGKVTLHRFAKIGITRNRRHRYVLRSHVLRIDEFTDPDKINTEEA